MALFALACKTGPLTVEIGQDELQARVAAQFPRTLQQGFGTVTLSDPRVLLEEGSNRLGLELDAKLQVGILPPASAELALSGEPRYDPAQKSFFLDAAKVERLDVAGLPEAQSAQLKGIVEVAAVAALKRLPVYELQQRNLKELTAEHVLSSVAVKNGKLVAVLGLSR